jgi:hypothetical protein
LAGSLPAMRGGRLRAKRAQAEGVLVLKEGARQTLVVM